VVYSIRIKASAERALRKLERADRERLVSAIDRLATEPHSGSVLKGEYSGLRRLRVGRYRIVYEARDRELLILVVRVAHRRDAYRP
jgi:mRNA interferase RelE/StbE